jgi:quinol monooxygenase YgiN
MGGDAGASGRHDSGRGEIAVTGGVKEGRMEVFSFVKFHAAAGNEREVEDALHEVISRSREEEGCVRINAFRGTRDPRVFYIHSQWSSEEVFENHAKLAHTVRFLELMEEFIDQPREVTRTELLA